MYTKDPSKSEWLRMFSKPGEPSLLKFLNDIPNASYRAIWFKTVKRKSKTDLLKEHHADYFIAILAFNQGNQSYDICINKGLNEIYDPMGKYALLINKKSSDIDCGGDGLFSKFGAIAKIVFF